MTLVDDEILEEHLEESRNMNELVRTFTADRLGWMTTEGLVQMRANPILAEEPLPQTEVRTIDGPGGDLELRILRPESRTARGVYLEIHGGGWCIGAAEHSDATNWTLVESAGIATVGVQYRLAPEHPYPAGPDDCLAAARWLVDNATNEFGTDRLVIGGGSAGAHLSAHTLLRLRDLDDAAGAFCGANLVFGAFDLGMSPSQQRSADLLVVPKPVLEMFYGHFLPGLTPEARRDPEYSPLYADLAGMPPALFTVGTLDPLLDDSLFMAARWEAAGNDAELVVFPESVHGFVAFPTEIGRRGREVIAAFVSRCFD